MTDIKQNDNHGTLHQVRQYATFEQFYDDIPIEGSLGILAYGASAILAWKRKRRDVGWMPPKPVSEKSKTREPHQKKD